MKSQQDKASKAYASISSQLKEWDHLNPAAYGNEEEEEEQEKSGNLYSSSRGRRLNSNSRSHNHSRNRNQQVGQPTTPFYFQQDDEDGEEDDHTLHYVSKRESGAFSPLADLHPDHGSAAKKTPVSTKKTRNNTNSATGGLTSSDNYDSAPVETPMTVGASSSNRNVTPSSSIRAKTYNGTTARQNASQGFNKSTAPAVAAAMRDMPSGVHGASLDGDYRPYHDALHFLLVQSKASNLKSKRNMISLQYLCRLGSLAYLRATRLREEVLLLQQQQQQEYGDLKSTNSIMETSIRSLEREGHLGSLIYRLAEQSEVIMTTKTTTTTMMDEEMNPSINDFLFFHPPNVSVIEKEVMDCVCNLVSKNQHLDLAAVDLYLKDTFGDGWLKHVKKQDIAALPMVIMRRQVILDWLESCHEKTLGGQDWIVSGNNGSGSGANKIMWKDTLDKFIGDQHSFMTSSVGVGMKIKNDRVQEYHPDAPLMVVSKHRRAGKVNDAPLYGNDNKREMDLLEKCLLLLKAGKVNRIYELCHEVGQPWRAATWDGDAPHGFVVVSGMDAVGVGGREEKEREMDLEEDGNQSVLVGNPQRSLWKRNLWEMSQNLHSLIHHQQQQNGKQFLQQQDKDVNRDDQGKSVVRSGSIVYEAAISAILANNSKIALQNPLLSNDWMDSLWVFYHGLQARFREIVYHEHNNLKREMESSIKLTNMHPLDGTEYQQEEKEQLESTSELSRVEEGIFLSRLAGRGGMKSFGDWDKGITAFLRGMNEAQKYIANSIRFLVDAANQKKQHETYDSFLRFMLHLVLFFESLCVDEDDDNPVASGFYSSAIAPQRNDLIMAYLHKLMKRKPLWEFYNLYASILPDELLIAACTDFWSTLVYDEKDRHMMLKSAREYFGQGTDLVILRNVVRASFAPMEEYSDPLLVAAWLGQPSDCERYDEELESMITHDDIRKMHSIRWMCIHHEHYPDAIVCANMLLRSFLLEFCLSNETPQNDEFDDWTNSPIVYTAKVFQARFLPRNIVQIAYQSAADSEHGLTQDEVDDYVSEYQALVQFLDAHSAYETWKDCISDASPNVAFSHYSRFEDNTVESDVATKIQIMNYVKKKKEIAQGLIKVATAAKDSLMKVLEFDNGWLNIFEDSNMGGNQMDGSDDEQNERCRQIEMLRSKCLSTTVSLMFRVCHTTALWMDDFTRDVEAIFENDYSNIMSRITGYGFFESKGMPNPFQPVSWHRMALLMANTVASSETKIADCMSKDDLANFMNCMAETNICLLRIQEQISSGD